MIWDMRGPSAPAWRPQCVAILGSGAFGRVVAARLQTGMVPYIHVWDAALADPSKEEDWAGCGWEAHLIGAEVYGGFPVIPVPVVQSSNVRQALEDADLVIHTHEGDPEALIAAAVAQSLKPGAYFLDFTARDDHSELEAAVARSSGKYVQAETSAPTAHWQTWQPVTLRGAEAQSLLPRLKALGFAGARVGLGS